MAGRAAEAANRSILLGGHVRREGVAGRSGEKGTKTWGRARRVRAGAGGGWSGAAVIAAVIALGTWAMALLMRLPRRGA